ncbi:hypothetical protein J2S03_000056 [Alicyclobacillus cycloheptanicus]|uniref:Uncharacterized protein n=1 Tax=Alicyclobacillus cycloheptanicus TaxID=1457 RepID=A0ABT9XDJ1_9BACL|nr:hypothetical protein [Alicyclobacillus cycloheptanicus]
MKHCAPMTKNTRMIFGMIKVKEPPFGGPSNNTD